MSLFINAIMSLFRRRSGKITPRSAPPRDAWGSPRYDEAELSAQLSRSLNMSDLTRSHDLHGTHLRSKSLRRSLGYDNTSGRVTQRVSVNNYT